MSTYQSCEIYQCQEYWRFCGLYSTNDNNLTKWSNYTLGATLASLNLRKPNRKLLGGEFVILTNDAQIQAKNMAVHS